MDRNLDRRVEAVVPVEDHDAQARLAEILEVMLADDRRSWQLRAGRDLGPDRGRSTAREGTIDTFETLKEDALAARRRRRSAARGPAAGAGSLDPRA